VWKGVQGIFDALLVAGLLVTATGIVVLGVAMRADPPSAGWLRGSARCSAPPVSRPASPGSSIPPR